MYSRPLAVPAYWKAVSITQETLFNVSAHLAETQSNLTARRILRQESDCLDINPCLSDVIMPPHSGADAEHKRWPDRLTAISVADGSEKQRPDGNRRLDGLLCRSSRALGLE